jgi:16S rRNA (cytosine967-C5)-methyltransferase
MPSLLSSKPPALTVIDACAGAGGKTLAIADYLRGAGRIFGYDVSEKKIQALRLRARRSGHRSIKAMTLLEGEERAVLQPFFGTADRVLVDAPCSGIGILRRSPDIKWNQRPEDFEGLPEIQLRLLQLYSALVKPGGSLIYSTCTIRRAECDDVVERFISGSSVFTKEHGGYFGPIGSGADGFFMQEFRREP